MPSQVLRPVSGSSVRFAWPAVVVTFATVAWGASWPAPDQLTAQQELPEVLTGFDGSRIASTDQWLHHRRPELKALFEHYMYGHAPPRPVKPAHRLLHATADLFGGQATLKEVSLALGPGDAPRLQLLLVLPTHVPRPAPVFVGLNFAGNHALLHEKSVGLTTNWIPNRYPGVVDNRATDQGRGTQRDVWCVEECVRRGFALATAFSGDVEPEVPDAPVSLRQWYRRQEPSASYDWGAVAAYAWTLQRIVDYVAEEPSIDSRRIALFGHSRNGKAALLAAALDERVALVISHQAGCGGTAPSRGKIGESVKQINDRFPHWFSARFHQFNDCPEKLPFDQHCLIALCAPRPVLLSNATDDVWANPAGQFAMLQAADPVYRLLGADGLRAAALPPLGQVTSGNLAFFLRAGKHATTPEDWRAFLDFADRHFRQSAARKVPR